MSNDSEDGVTLGAGGSIKNCTVTVPALAEPMSNKPVSPTNKVQCFKCHRVLMQECRDNGDFTDDGGLWFEARGGWPSSLHDPICARDEQSVLAVFICDECLKAGHMLVAVAMTRKAIYPNGGIFDERFAEPWMQELRKEKSDE